MLSDRMPSLDQGPHRSHHLHHVLAVAESLRVEFCLLLQDGLDFQRSAFGKEYAKRASWIGPIRLMHRCLPRAVSQRLQLSAAVTFATRHAVYCPKFALVSLVVVEVTAFGRWFFGQTHRQYSSIDRR
jgi:hypothetical protein